MNRKYCCVYQVLRKVLRSLHPNGDVWSATFLTTHFCCLISRWEGQDCVIFFYFGNSKKEFSVFFLTVNASIYKYLIWWFRISICDKGIGIVSYVKNTLTVLMINSKWRMKTNKTKIFHKTFFPVHCKTLFILLYSINFILCCQEIMATPTPASHLMLFIHLKSAKYWKLEVCWQSYTL